MEAVFGTMIGLAVGGAAIVGGRLYGLSETTLSGVLIALGTVGIIASLVIF